MKNKLKSSRRNSKTAPASQPKTSQGRTNVRPASPSPSIVLFLERDGGVNEEGIDLSVAEYAALKRAAAPTGDGILMFMANAALEKVGQSGALPVKRGAKQPSCFCFYGGGVGELAGEIPLVGREFGSVVIAACQKRITVDQFIADAIKENTWGIATEANQALHRTLSGQLLIVNRTPADMSGNQHFHNPRYVSYSEACEWIRNSGNRWKPEVILRFHGIQASAANVVAAAHPSAAARTQVA
jgi:hypothetical protein